MTTGRRGGRCGSPLLVLRARGVFALLHSLDDQRHSVAAAEAERGEAALQAEAMQGVEQRDEHSRAARADRMAERDCAAGDVGLFGIDAERFCAGDALGQQLVNRIAAIERLAATDPGLDVNLSEDRVLAALPQTSVRADRRALHTHHRPFVTTGKERTFRSRSLANSLRVFSRSSPELVPKITHPAAQAGSADGGFWVASVLWFGKG